MRDERTRKRRLEAKYGPGNLCGWEDIDVEGLALQMNLNQRTVKAKLTGKSDPGLRFMEEVAQNLGLDVAVVLLRILDARTGVSRKEVAALKARENPKTYLGRRRARLRAVLNDPYLRDEVGDY